MNTLTNINTLQNLTDVTYLTSYSNEYLISALANLGQRSNIQDNYIVYDSLELNKIISNPAEDGFYAIKIDSTIDENSMVNSGIKYIHVSKEEIETITTAKIVDTLNTNGIYLFSDVTFNKIFDFTLYNPINNIDSYDLYFFQDDVYLKIYIIGYTLSDEVEYAYYKLKSSSKDGENSTYYIEEALIYYNIAIYEDGGYKSYWSKIYFTNIKELNLTGVSKGQEKSILNKSVLNGLDSTNIYSYYVYYIDSDLYYKNIPESEKTSQGYLPNEAVVKQYLSKEKCVNYINNDNTFLSIIDSIIRRSTGKEGYNPYSGVFIEDVLRIRIGTYLLPNLYNHDKEELNLYKYTVGAFYIDETNVKLEDFDESFKTNPEVFYLENIIQKEYLHLLNQVSDAYFSNKFSSANDVKKYILYKLIGNAEKTLISENNGITKEDIFIIVNPKFSIKYIHDKNNLLYIYSLLNYFHTEFISIKDTEEIKKYDFNLYNNYMYCRNKSGVNKINISTVEPSSTNNEYDNIFHSFDVQSVYTLPYIDKNGEWVVNDTKTNYSSIGENSGNPNMFYIIQENKWKAIDNGIKYNDIPDSITLTAYFNEELSMFFNSTNNTNEYYKTLNNDLTSRFEICPFITPTTEELRYYDKNANYLSCTHISKNTYEGGIDGDIYNNEVITFWNYTTLEDNDGNKDVKWSSINSDGKPFEMVTYSMGIKQELNKIFSYSETYGYFSELINNRMAYLINNTNFYQGDYFDRICYNISNHLYERDFSYLESAFNTQISYYNTYIITRETNYAIDKFNVALEEAQSYMYDRCDDYINSIDKRITDAGILVDNLTTYSNRFERDRIEMSYFITSFNNINSNFTTSYNAFYNNYTEFVNSYNNIVEILDNANSLSKKVIELENTVKELQNTIEELRKDK